MAVDRVTFGVLGDGDLAGECATVLTALGAKVDRDATASHARWSGAIDVADDSLRDPDGGAGSGLPHAAARAALDRRPGCPTVRAAGPLDAARLWAGSGAMWLTGDPDGPSLAPSWPVALHMRALDLVFELLSSLAGHAVRVDGPALLGERAALTGLSRGGMVSVGGACRLLRAVDGWIAVSLARPYDVAALAALMRRDRADADPWADLVAYAAVTPRDQIIESATLLGVAAGALGERGPAPRAAQPWAQLVAFTAPLVVDLSSLWAGPLCASLLGEVGTTVVKVEMAGRPDGARRGSAAFHDMLNHDKLSVVIAADRDEGRRALLRLVEAAGVVVTGLRPRVLREWGVAEPLDGVWVAITGHGRRGTGADRIAFGDDAAVAGGLVAWGEDGVPRFCADAVADPLTGLSAAVSALAALLGSPNRVVDAALSAAAARPRRTTEVRGLVVSPPRSRAATAPARPLGADTDSVLAEQSPRR